MAITADVAYLKAAIYGRSGRTLFRAVGLTALSPAPS
jgi:hypothetical protein